MLIHTSIAELKELGVYDHYCSLIAPESLSAISELIGPGWMPARLALEHYRTCDKLGLRDEQIHDAGLNAGEKMGDALLIATKAEATADRSPWAMIGAFARMGRRVYEGSSSQYVKLGSNQLEVENVGNPMFSVRYYRVGHCGFMSKAFSSLGVDVTEVKLSTYRSGGAEIDVRLTWK
jgi:hypothetical protein